jgi:metallo-beta-lactamase family protein
MRLFGREIPIRAQVAALQSFSGHADSDELIAWMRHARTAPATTYITHGEPDAADALRARVKRELGWHCRVPEHLERVELIERRAE